MLPMKWTTYLPLGLPLALIACGGQSNTDAQITAVNQEADQAKTAQQALAQMNGALTHQTTLLAATDLFWISGWLFLVLIASVWLATRPAGGAPVGAH